MSMETVDFKTTRRKVVINFTRYLLILLAIVLLSLFYLGINNLNVLYISVLCMLIHNLLYGYLDFKERMLFVFFQFTFFLFLMTKPIIAIFRHEAWWDTIYEDFASNANISRMLVCMLLSLFMIWIGALLGERKRTSKNHAHGNNYTDLLRKNMQYISLSVFVISSVFSLMQGFEKIRFASTHSYLEYYTSFSTQLPYIVRLLASFTRYSFCFYLASLPTKRQAFLPCILYVALAIPSLIMGGRADICLNLILIFFYYLLRDSWGDSGVKWFGKWERRLVFIGSPFLLVFLGVYIDIRVQRSVNFSTIPSAIVNFFNDQGITFSYMCAGMGNVELLPERTSYTFGTIIDYFKYGSIGRLLMNTSPLGDTNSLLRASEGNSYAHHMSYILLGEDYLNGRGIGSSYINEIFADLGYAGIVVFSLFLGFLLIYFVRAAARGCWQCAILMLCFSGIIYIPRAEFISFIDFITKLQFWVIIAACYCGVYLFGRKFIYRKC